jgi:pentatricopeptide repeat protein
LQIEEAKAKGRAQLGLAFEMLTMMKKRGLRCDPEAYQTLIDACGRVGDTKRATDLLALMHEDGIVGK